MGETRMGQLGLSRRKAKWPAKGEYNGLKSNIEMMMIYDDL